MLIWYRHLAVLSRAVHFQNLTAASQHVGLSQPQLSRLVGQLEQGLGVVLLDRGVRRKTNWTPLAHRLAEVYDHTEHRLERSLKELVSEGAITDLRAACLEGLVDVVLGCLDRLRRAPHWRVLHLDVLDQSDLEGRFLAGAVDVVWTSRVPGKGKPRHQLELGYQTLDVKDSGHAVDVLSRYEFGQRRKAPAGRLTLVSNSLRVRQTWLERFGGKGKVPSPIKAHRERGQMPVLMIGSELLPELVWNELTAAAGGAKS